MSSKFTKSDIDWRLNDCRRYGYDPDRLAEIWGISSKGCASFMRNYCRDEYFKAMTRRKSRSLEHVRVMPEYENQRMFDLFVLEKAEWCGKWQIPLWEYANYLRIYQRQYGKRIPTPERREVWARGTGE